MVFNFNETIQKMKVVISKTFQTQTKGRIRKIYFTSLRNLLQIHISRFRYGIWLNDSSLIGLRLIVLTSLKCYSSIYFKGSKNVTFKVVTMQWLSLNLTQYSLMFVLRIAGRLQRITIDIASNLNRKVWCAIITKVYLTLTVN